MNSRIAIASALLKVYFLTTTDFNALNVRTANAKDLIKTIKHKYCITYRRPNFAIIMKTPVTIFCLSALFALIVAFSYPEPMREPQSIPPSLQQSGDPAKGYEYLVTGDFIKSGVPYKFFIMAAGEDSSNRLGRTGKNATISHAFNVINNDGVDMVVPTCLQCHAQVFDNKLYIGLGNTFADFSRTKKKSKSALLAMQLASPRAYKAGKDFFNAYKTLSPKIRAEVYGVNTADRLAAVLVAHRDPQTLKWSRKPLLDIPDEVYPTDVPAWWLLKKKNAMFYNGFGRGDFARFLMASNLLTVKDTSEANEVYSHFGDVLAYIQSIKPPKYPNTIDHTLAHKGEQVFNNNCNRCHGTYGTDEQYPNLLIPESMIGTDSMLFKANQQNPQFINWFNKSWFAKGDNPAKLVPYEGYIAPPLDGIWITAPYLHNGSVPTLEALLDSKQRPAYWSRKLSSKEYDYEHIGWKYTAYNEPQGNKAYNTTLPGYGNFGHYFGDHLTDEERKAVIEYLKTL